MFPAICAGLLILTSAARADYQATVLSDNPLAYYPLSVAVDPTGTTATDVSGNGNSGTYNNTTPQNNNVSGPSTTIPSALSSSHSTPGPLIRRLITRRIALSTAPEPIGKPRR